MARATPPANLPANTPAVAIGLLLAAVVIVYWPVCTFEFVSWDDVPYIAANPTFANASWADLGHYWAAPLESIYIPLTNTAWMVLAILGRSDTPDADGLLLNPYLFHTANLIVHALATLAVFDVLRRLKLSVLAAWAGALVFGVHPVQVESVAWVSGLKDVLAGALSFAAIGGYLAAVDCSDVRGRRRRYVGATALLAAAMLAKPSAMTTPAVVIAVDWLLLRRPWKTVLTWAGPWLVMAIVCAAVARAFQPVGEALDTPLWARPLIVGHSLAFYVRQIVWPTRMGLDYGHNPAALMDSRWLALAWIVPAVLMGAAAVLYRRVRWPAAAMAVFVLGSAHTLGLVGFDFQRISTTADHYLYVPMLGIAIAVAFAASHLPRRVAIGVTAVVAVLLFGLSFRQVQTWRDSGTLFAHGLSVNPDSWAIRTSIGVLAMEQKPPDLPTAERESRRAIELMPTYARPYNTLGAVRAVQGDLPGATAAYRKAVELSPTPELLTNLGSLLAHQGRLDEAEALLERAVAINPNHAKALLNLGTTRIQRGRHAEAAALLGRAAALSPYDPQIRLNYAIALLEAGRRAEGVTQLRAAYRLSPDFPGVAETLRQVGATP